jgi:sporulation protein YlmC with PRC-barrel domain
MLSALLAVVLATNPAAGQRGTFAPPSATVQASAPISTDKLIGREIRNAQDRTIGEIKSVVLNADGRVQAVIVGVGGFLGLGEREVAIGWENLQVRNDGEAITTDLTEAQLRALPEYKYADQRQRGTVFAPRTEQRAAQTTERSQQPITPAAWNMRASELIGLDVRNTQNESIGQIKELVVDLRGDVQAVVVSAGGFLGLGDRNVAIDWKQLQFNREKGGLVASLSMSKDQLKSLPEYKLPKR